jgi:CheY-like chemotaxis protein
MAGNGGDVVTEDAQRAILVVEDHESLRSLLGITLRHHGFATLEAGNAAEALRLFHAHRSVIDLAIIDMVLPGMSGLDLAVELERQQPDLKILYTSGYVNSIAMEVIARHSPELVLLKPFTQPRLIEQVAYLLGLPRPHPATGDNTAAVWVSRFPWDRLMEASDSLGPDAAKLLRYKNTAAGYGIAAAHAAALRAAGVPYSFLPSDDLEHPVELRVTAEDLERAQEMTSRVGIGADIAPAA